MQRPPAVIGLLALLAVTRSVAAPSLDEARKLLSARDLPGAKAAFEQIAAAEPGNAEAFSYLSRVALATDDVAAAVTAGEKAVALAPQNSDYRRRLGDAYGRSAQKAGIFSKLSFANKCREAYEKAVALDPANLDARNALVVYYTQAPSIAGGGLDKAYAQAAEINRLDPNRGRGVTASLYVHEKKYAEAFGLYEEILRASPDDYAALYQIGRLAAVTGERAERGLAALTRCLALPVPDGQPGAAPVQWRIGNLREKLGDKAAARVAYEAALKADPKFAAAAESLKKL
jgi:tetratricopeptide (TPR) repeat protein